MESTKELFISGIYKITSPSNKIYIGQSKNLEKRKKDYKYLKGGTKSKVLRSIKKYGWTNHKFEVVCYCDVSKLNELEKYYVELFQSFNSKHGMNLKEGGGSRGKLSDESIEKIKQKRKLQIPPTLGYRRPNKKPKPKLPPIGFAWIGRKHKYESRVKQSLAKIGNKINNKKVMRIDTKEVFSSVTEAADSIGISMKSLSQRIRLGIKKQPQFTYDF